MLIVDDGSDDDSVKIINEYCKQDSRIHLFQNEHGGTARARNAALDKTAGQYIAYIDADDAYHPRYLETMEKAIIDNKAEIVLCRTVRGTDETGFLSSIVEPIYQKTTSEIALKRMYEGEWPDFIAPYTKLYRAELFSYVRFPDGMYFEDAATIFKPIFYANSIAVTEEALYFYNITPNSSSITKRSNELLDREKALRSHLEFYLSQHREDLVNITVPFYLTEMIATSYRIRQSDNPNAEQFIREHFKRTYRQYKNKIVFTKKQEESFSAYLHPKLYDIKRMLKQEGPLKTVKGFLERKLTRKHS